MSWEVCEAIALGVGDALGIAVSFSDKEGDPSSVSALGQNPVLRHDSDVGSQSGPPTKTIRSVVCGVLLVAALIFVVMMTARQATCAGPSTVDQIVAQADAAIQQGDSQNALAIVKSGLRDYPSSADLYRKRNQIKDQMAGEPKESGNLVGSAGLGETGGSEESGGGRVRFCA